MRTFNSKHAMRWSRSNGNKNAFQNSKAIKQILTFFGQAPKNDKRTCEYSDNCNFQCCLLLFSFGSNKLIFEDWTLQSENIIDTVFFITNDHFKQCPAKIMKFQTTLSKILQSLKINFKFHPLILMILKCVDDEIVVVSSQFPPTPTLSQTVVRV